MDKYLEKLITTFGVSGHEKAIRNYIKEQFKDKNFDIQEDALGNLILKIGQGEEKWMFCAHMDHMGLIVTHIDDRGFIRVSPVGEFDASSAINTMVQFENGTLGRVCSTKSSPSLEDLYIDTGMEDTTAVLKKIKLGDVAAFLTKPYTVGNHIIASNLDSRLGCHILLQLIKGLEDSNKELYFVFSSQNILGGRGARAAANKIEPHYCIVLDAEDAGDTLSEESKIALNKGPVICIKDATLIMHHEIKEKLETAAQEADITIQHTINRKKSDGGMIHKEKEGVKTGVLSIPCRYNSSLYEIASLKDVKDTVSLLKKVISL